MNTKIKILRISSIALSFLWIMTIVSCRPRKDNDTDKSLLQDFSVKEANDTTFLKGYRIPRSQLQVVEIIDKIVKETTKIYSHNWNRNNWFYELSLKNGSDSILFRYYYPYDDLQNLLKPDSTIIILKEVGVIFQIENGIPISTIQMNDNELANSIKKFDSLVMEGVYAQIEIDKPYKIKSVASNRMSPPFYFIVDRGTGYFDTLKVESINGRLKISK